MDAGEIVAGSECPGEQINKLKIRSADACQFTTQIKEQAE
jgi:hypothetical protein